MTEPERVMAVDQHAGVSAGFAHYGRPLALTISMSPGRDYATASNPDESELMARIPAAPIA
jgi:hypothetical protein